MSKNTTPAALVRSIREYLAVQSDLWTLDGQGMDTMALELARVALAVQDARRIAAEHAVMHLIKRISTDPRLAWLIGPCTESLELLMVAAAAISGQEIDTYRETFLKDLKTQPLPGIGKEAVVIDAELIARMSQLNDGALDFEDLVHHFLDLGLEAEQATRDNESERLF